MIEETEEYEIAEMEHTMNEDPLYHMWSAEQWLRTASKTLWNTGDVSTREHVDNALQRVLMAIKLLEEQNVSERNIMKEQK